MNLHELLPRLTGVRRSGNGYIARCPAHDDRTPSLSFAQIGERISASLFRRLLCRGDLRRAGHHPQEPVRERQQRSAGVRASNRPVGDGVEVAIMRDYGKIAPQFWNGPTGRKIRRLGIECQVVALYLVTAPTSNALGLYYLPLPILCHEVAGLTLEGASKALQSLSDIGFAHYDAKSSTRWLPSK
jgi:hypothetical protein